MDGHAVGAVCFSQMLDACDLQLLHSLAAGMGLRLLHLAHPQTRTGVRAMARRATRRRRKKSRRASASGEGFYLIAAGRVDWRVMAV